MATVSRDEVLRELKVEEIVHPDSDSLTNFNILVKLGILQYDQANVFLDGSNNPINPRDIPDIGTIVYLLGLVSGMSKAVINKLGSDVDVNGQIDLSSEIIPTNATYTTYINGVSGFVQISFDETSKIAGGFGDELTASDTIKIIFI